MASPAASIAKTARGRAISTPTFKAPLFERILNADESERRQVILDLGGPNQTLLDRLSATRPCRFEIADFVANGGPAVLEAIESDEEVDRTYGAAVIRRLLPGSNAEPLDLILCWDLPNYMSLKNLKLFCEVLAERAAPGCRLHMLIAYSKREMPFDPARYLLRDDGQLTQACRSDEIASAPRYSPEDLNLAVAPFRYERGVLLANGMQEFVYAWPE